MPDDDTRKKKGDILFINEKELDLKALGEGGIKLFWSVGEKTSMSEEKFYLKTKYNYVLPKGSIIFGEKMLETDKENEMLEKFNETLECFKLWVESDFKQRFLKKENGKLSAHIKQQKTKEIKLYFLAINIFNMDSINVPDRLIQVSQKELRDCLKNKKIIRIGGYTFLIDVVFVYIQNPSRSLPHPEREILADEQHIGKNLKTQSEERIQNFEPRNDRSEQVPDEIRKIFDSKSPTAIPSQ